MKKVKIIIPLFLLVCIICVAIFIGVKNSKNTANEDVTKITVKQISFNHKNRNINIDLPINWEYELNEDEDESLNYIIKVYPSKDNKEKYIIINEDSSFGVCGTGLEIKNIELNNGKSANIGYYYNENNTWSFITISEYDNLYAWNMNLNEEEGKTALDMIKTLKYN